MISPALSHMNGGSLALAGAIVAILLRKRAIGGWLLYFFFQLLLGLGLVLTTTHWRRYLANSWSDPRAYFLFSICNLSRTILLVAIAAITLTLFLTRHRPWVGGLRLALTAYALANLAKFAADLFYFPESLPADALSLAFPTVWIAYFAASRRVAAVFGAPVP